MACICIADHNPRTQVIPPDPDTGYPAVLGRDLVHRHPELHATSLGSDYSDHGIGNGLNAAHGIMNPELFFEMADEGVDRGHASGVAADEQGVEAERHAQSRVTHVPAHISQN